MIYGFAFQYKNNWLNIIKHLLWRTSKNENFYTRLFNQIEYLKSKLINININYKNGEHGNLLKIAYFSLQSWWF